MRIPSTLLMYEFSADMPEAMACRVKEECVFETLDCFGEQMKSEQDDLAAIDLGRTNPATGPVLIQGAERGKLLRVEILDITCFSPGIVSTHPKIGVLRSTFNRSFFKMVALSGNRCHIDGVSLPIEPMVGVMGVAPERGSVSTRVPGRHGGNLDTREIRPGNTVYLPIFQDGALFALGDVHAAMGDGEICGAGVEVPAEVRVKFDVVENRLDLNSPLIEDREHFIFLHSAPTLEEAFHEAALECLMLLRRATSWSAEKLYLLMSAACHFQVSQLVDPLLTVKIFIPKEVFPFPL